LDIASLGSHGLNLAALLYAFLLGCICGSALDDAPAVVAWGAHLGRLHLEASLFAFFAKKISLVKA
jgi:uncharacterized membrane protein